MKLIIYAAILPLVFHSPDPQAANLILSEEVHFSEMRQLTFGGQNAEGYFSNSERELIFQSTRDSLQCDQQFILDLGRGDVRMVSSGLGRTTCGYFMPGDTHILYASTDHFGEACPPLPDYSKGYTWAVYPEFDIFIADREGNERRQLTNTPGYDAEATVSPMGDRIVFTSVRDGDLDIYTMNIDGSDVQRLTTEVGYDGGAFFSWDGKHIVYRAWHHETEADVKAYRDLLGQNLVRPSRMEIFVMDADGGDKRMLTNNGAANFAPFFHPDNNRIIFASNVGDPKGRNFDLYLINIDGSGMERVTYNDTFDGFPMFSRDGQNLVFASNRNGKVRGETNLFIAKWKE